MGLHIEERWRPWRSVLRTEIDTVRSGAGCPMSVLNLLSLPKGPSPIREGPSPKKWVLYSYTHRVHIPRPLLRNQTRNPTWIFEPQVFKDIESGSLEFPQMTGPLSGGSCGILFQVECLQAHLCGPND